MNESSSLRRVCRVLGISRARLHKRRRERMKRRHRSDALLARLRALIQQHPTYGYRQLHVLIRQELGHAVNRFWQYRILCNSLHLLLLSVVA